MKHLLVLGATVMLASGPLAVAGDLKSQLMANEKLFWTSKDAAALSSLLTEDSVQIRQKDVLTGRDTIARDAVAEDCSNTKLEVMDVQLKELSKEVVALLYTIEFDRVCSGKREAGRQIASSIWKQQNGKWLNALYQSTPIA
jgi:hypothetical protein